MTMNFNLCNLPFFIWLCALVKPVLHDWYVLSCLWECAYKRNLAAYKKSSPCSGSSGFPLSLSEWSFTIGVTPYNRIKMSWVHHLNNNILPSFLFFLCFRCRWSGQFWRVLLDNKNGSHFSGVQDWNPYLREWNQPWHMLSTQEVAEQLQVPQPHFAWSYWRQRLVNFISVWYS